MAALGRPRELGAGDDACRRTREQRLVRMTGTERNPHQSAVRLHQEFLRRSYAARIEPLFETVQIVGDAGPDVRVDDRGGKPRVFANDGQHLARDRDAAIGRLVRYDFGGAPLVRRIDEGEQEADGDRLCSLANQVAHRSAQCLLVERSDDLALVIEAFDDLFRELLRHEQRRLLVEGIEQVGAARLRPAARLVDGAEAFRD